MRTTFKSTFLFFLLLSIGRTNTFLYYTLLSFYLTQTLVVHCFYIRHISCIPSRPLQRAPNQHLIRNSIGSVAISKQTTMKRIKKKTLTKSLATKHCRHSLFKRNTYIAILLRLWFFAVFVVVVVVVVLH